jgi:hypothetical protein
VLDRGIETNMNNNIIETNTNNNIIRNGKKLTKFQDFIHKYYSKNNQDLALGDTVWEGNTEKILNYEPK